jgi:hypothetical protein
MPFVCEATGEMVAKFDEGVECRVETSSRTLVSTTVVMAHSAEPVKLERWHCMEDYDLNPTERQRWHSK